MENNAFQHPGPEDGGQPGPLAAPQPLRLPARKLGLLVSSQGRRWRVRGRQPWLCRPLYVPVLHINE